MKAVSIENDGKVVEFSSEQELLEVFGAEKILEKLPTDVDIIYVYIDPFQHEINGKFVLCWNRDEFMAKHECYESTQDI